MNDSITITDDLSQKTITLSFSQYYDLIIGLDCASEEYEEAGQKSRSKDFKKLTKTLETITSDYVRN
jgi:hypothetical protein